MKLTEEEFKELEEFFATYYWKEYYPDRLQKAKQKGWIKKTALEEAREFEMIKPPIIQDGEILYYGSSVKKKIELYEQAIKEAQENK